MSPPIGRQRAAQHQHQHQQEEEAGGGGGGGERRQWRRWHRIDPLSHSLTSLAEEEEKWRRQREQQEHKGLCASLTRYHENPGNPKIKKTNADIVTSRLSSSSPPLLILVCTQPKPTICLHKQPVSFLILGNGGGGEGGRKRQKAFGARTVWIGVVFVLLLLLLLVLPGLISEENKKKKKGEKQSCGSCQKAVHCFLLGW